MDGKGMDYYLCHCGGRTPRCGDEVGYGTTELMVVGKYPRYGYQGYGVYGELTERGSTQTPG